MLKELRLSNLVLVENAVIDFAKGFNVLSGESGSGKSAIMNALNLIAGDRSDANLIRRGSSKGLVEAIFDVDSLSAVHQLLDSAGITHENGDELIISRELSATGKSRAFINNQMAQLSLLRQLSDLLFEIVGQHANQKLLSLDYHRQVLDSYGDLLEDVAAFGKSWEEENKIAQQLESLISSEAQRMREIEVCRMEIEELEEANLKEGEDEELFAEYTRLSHADELLQKAGDLTRLLSGEKNAVITLLSRYKSTFDQLITLAPQLAEAATTYQTALLELHEVAHTLSTFESRIEHNPARADELNSRLEMIAKLKRKYGATVEEMKVYLTTAKDKLSRLENADMQIEHLQEQLETVRTHNNAMSANLSAKRQKVAKPLQKAIVGHLTALNMPKVEIFVEITPQKRNRLGDDKIELFITPNVGERRVSLRECASGGELSRTMLALQAVLAGKEQTPTIIFDEIDANIGGETATVVGEKLHQIGTKHQIVCITHFPQVAKLAEHHLRISKQEIDGRTVTIVDSLDEVAHEHELLRMHGGKH